MTLTHSQVYLIAPKRFLQLSCEVVNSQLVTYAANGVSSRQTDGIKLTIS